MAEKLFFIIQAWWYLIKSTYDSKTKLRFLLQSLFLTLFSWILDMLWYSSVSVWRWLKLFWFNTSFVSGLFHENRIQNEYYFESKKQNPIIIDGGSNIWDSMLYFKYLYPSSTIYCFEPDSKNFAYLQKNITNNKLSNVYPEEKALWWKNKIIEFYFDEEPSYTHSTKPWRMTKNSKEVECIWIVDFIKDKKIDLLKLDIEWSELEVLESIDTHGLFNQIDQIILEYHHNITWEKSKLWYFLSILEKNWYTYQIQSNCFPMNQKNKYQDIHVFAYRN